MGGPDLDLAGADLVRTLGDLIVRPADKDGAPTNRPLSMLIEVSVEPDSIERGEDGKIEFAILSFKAAYEPSHWTHLRSGMHADDAWRIPYGDRGVERSINAFLDTLGLKGGVGWSERGRQERGVADFDADLALIEQLWPELAKEPTAAAAPGA